MKSWFSLHYTRDWERNSPFQQDSNLQNKAKSTLELLAMMTVNVPEWPSYSFDLNLRENVWQNFKLLSIHDPQNLDRA